MRLFIAVPVDEQVRAAASAVIEQLKKAGADVKWVSPETMHLTLAFLGETSDDKLEGIKDAVRRAVSGHTPFEMSFDRLGSFGAPSHPRVLWIGAGAGTAELSSLASGLMACLDAAGGIRDEEQGREFSAHLTIGRVRGPRNIKKLVAAMREAKVPAASCRAERLVLYRSKLSPQGPAHEVLHESVLKG